MGGLNAVEVEQVEVETEAAIEGTVSNEQTQGVPTRLT